VNRVKTEKVADDQAALQDLLGAVAAGDQAAFQSLYQATSAKLFGVVLRLVARRDLAEEVLQETYLRIWDRAADYRSERGSPMAWMMTIGRNRAIDCRRRLWRERPFHSDDEAVARPDPAPDPLDWAIAGAEARRVELCLEQLDKAQRDCLVLAICDGLTHDELSRRLERPLGTVKSWMRRGLDRLKLCLER